MQRYFTRLKGSFIPILLGFAFFFIFPILPANDAPPSGDKNGNSTVRKAKAKQQGLPVSDARIRAISGIVKRYSSEGLDDDDVRDLIYREIARSMPLDPKSKLLQKTEFELQTEVAKRVELKFPETERSLTTQFEKEADRKFKMANVREDVTVQFQRGNKILTVSGTLFFIRPTNIVVDDRTIPFLDMAPETRARFDKEFNQLERNKYVQTGIARHVRLRNAYAVELFQALLNEQNHKNEENGYILDPQTNLWLSARKKANEVIGTEVVRLAKKADRERVLAAQAAAKDPTVPVPPVGGVQVADTAPGVGPSSHRPILPVTPILPTTPGVGPILPPATITPPRETINPISPTNPSSGGPTLPGAIPLLPPADVPDVTPALPPPHDALYLELQRKVEKQLAAINSLYFGIDADQGYKKALWGFNSADVARILSTEPECAEMDNTLRNAYRFTIETDEGYPVLVDLRFKNNALYQTIRTFGNLTTQEFDGIYNLMFEKYGKSDEEKTQEGTNLFKQVLEGTYISPPSKRKTYLETIRKNFGSSDIRQVTAIEPDDSERREKNPTTLLTTDISFIPDAIPDVILPDIVEIIVNRRKAGTLKDDTPPEEFQTICAISWTGKISRAVLIFTYNKEKKYYESVYSFKEYTAFNHEAPRPSPVVPLDEAVTPPGVSTESPGTGIPAPAIKPVAPILPAVTPPVSAPAP